MVAVPERELIKTLINWPDYKITTLGRVWSIRRKKFLSPIKVNSYSVVKLYRSGEHRTITISKLVLEAFVGLCPKGYMVKHVNNDKADNRLVNLEWRPYKVQSQPIAPEDRIEAYDAFNQFIDKPGGLSKHWPLKEIIRCFSSVRNTKQAKQLLKDYKQRYNRG